MRLFLVLALLPVFLSATPISEYVHGAIMVIADREGIPRSVANQQQIEESGNYLTGAWGTPEAIGDDGASLGLYQIQKKYIPYFLSLYWAKDDGEFDVFDPIDNATLAMRLMADLHRRFGTWYLAACHYNAGPNVFEFSERTKEYARRIVEAP